MNEMLFIYGPATRAVIEYDPYRILPCRFGNPNMDSRRILVWGMKLKETQRNLVAAGLTNEPYPATGTLADFSPITGSIVQPGIADFNMGGLTRFYLN